MLKTRNASRLLAVLVSTALMVQAPFARAEIVETDAMTAQTQAEQDRAKVQGFVERADVAQKLQAMGVSGLFAADRVGSMTEEEVHAMAQRIDTLPAGGALSQMDWLLILLVAVLVVVAL
jgi:hypothetical protein